MRLLARTSDELGLIGYLSTRDMYYILVTSLHLDSSCSLVYSLLTKWNLNIDSYARGPRHQTLTNDRLRGWYDTDYILTIMTPTPFQHNAGEYCISYNKI
jgi:hypothetical protein